MSNVPWRNKRKDTTGELSPLVELRNEMDRLFDSFIREPFGSLSESISGRRAWVPAVDIAENDQEVTVRAEVPGVNPQDLEITVSGNRLTLAGEKKETSQQQGKDFYQSETQYGAFRRSVDLPSGVDPQQVTAEHSNGVVTITLKKSQPATPKRIEVKTT